MRLMTAFVFLLFSLINVNAHEGHDHSPGRKDAPQGGIVKESPNYHFELVARNQDIMIFVYDVDMKAIKDLSKISQKAFTQIPRKEKMPLSLEVMGNHWHGKFDRGTAHRFDFILSVVDGEKTEELKWVVD
jgi:hypothetical protein